MIVVENEETNNKKSNFDYDKLTKARVFIRCMLGYPFDFYGEDFHNCYIGKSDSVVYLVYKKPIKEVYSFNKVNEILSTDEYYCGTKSIALKINADIIRPLRKSGPLIYVTPRKLLKSK